MTTEYYVELDREIDAAEDDAVKARWQFGKALLAERVGKQLPAGRLDELVEVVGKSRAELQHRVRFAERYPSEAEVSNAVRHFRSWHQIVNEALATSANESKGTDEYFTPRWIFDELDLRFDIDVAAPKGGGTHVPAARSFTPDDDGLTREWDGRVWMNPPYSAPARWVDRFIRHGNGIALLPFAKSDWFFDLWRTAEVTIVAPGIRASKFDGGQIQMATFLAATGPTELHKAIQRLGVPR